MFYAFSGKKKIVACYQWYDWADMLASDIFKAKIVYLILSKDTNNAIEILSNHYCVIRPSIKVGMPKRYSKNSACYVHKNKTIHVSRREILYSPSIILHEFYHHLRSVKNMQGGIEKYADSFATEFIQAYNKSTKWEQ